MVQAYFSGQLQNNTEKGYSDSGDLVDAGFTPEGYKEISIKSPEMLYGAIYTESLTPAYQLDAVYGVNATQMVSGTRASGTITSSGGIISFNTGNTVFGQAFASSQTRLRPRAGQGIRQFFSAIYDTPVTNSIQLAGAGHSEDGIFVGHFLNSNFSVVYNRGGAREIRTLTITTASSTAENITVTLGGIVHSVPVTASANINRTVWEIATYASYIDYRASPVGNTVVFIGNNAGPKSGTFSVAGTTVAGTFSTTKVGVSTAMVVTPQSSFNVDPLDGSGPSGFDIDTTKGNTFGISIDSNFGEIDLSICVPKENGKMTFEPFHRIQAQNNRTTPLFENPAFALSYSAVSAGSTSNVTLKGSFGAGFIEGKKVFTGNKYSYTNTRATVGSTISTLFTIYNNRVFKNISNQGQIYLRSITASAEHNNPVIIYILKNVPLTGNPVFSQYDADSCSLYSTASTGPNITANSQIIWTGSIGKSGNLQATFNSEREEYFLSPGEWYTVATVTASGNAFYVTANINTIEEV